MDVSGIGGQFRESFSTTPNSTGYFYTHIAEQKYFVKSSKNIKDMKQHLITIALVVAALFAYDALKKQMNKSKLV